MFGFDDDKWVWFVCWLSPLAETALLGESERGKSNSGERDEIVLIRRKERESRFKLLPVTMVPTQGSTQLPQSPVSLLSLHCTSAFRAVTLSPISICLTFDLGLKKNGAGGDGRRFTVS